MARKALIHQIEARERRGRWFGALATLLSMSLLLSGWVGLFAFLGTNSAYGTFEELQEEWVPDTRSMELTLPDLSRVSRVYASSGEVLAELHDGRNSEPIPYEEVPPVMVYAILAAEDADFFEHEGVDFSAIASAAIDNIIFDTTRGGSTITQQVVKNAFVGNEISIRRKVNEAFVSAELERRFTKERILEFYMNSVYFGSGAYGVETAAEEFFSKDLDDLEIHEAAALAVLVRNPSLYNPRTAPERTLERRDEVITQMAEEGWIRQTQADSATSQPLDVVDSPLRRGEADHVVAEVKRQLLDLNNDEFTFLGNTSEARKRAIFGCPADDTACEGGGGLQIFTTIDLRLQKEANRVLNEWLPLPPYEENLQACASIFPDFDERQAYYETYAETSSCKPTGAISMVENQTGAVRVMASGLPFEFSQFDLAIQGRRNPGSSFKPIGLVTALEEGYTLGHRWSGQSPIRIECEFACAPDGGNIWTVRGVSTGVITLEEATYRSVNGVYAQVSRDTGPENIVAMARRMGITNATLEPVLSIVLGTGAVSPLEMASAYSNFATNGAHSDDYIVSRIVDHTGEVIYEHEQEATQVADPAIFAAARRALLKVPTNGTAATAMQGFPYMTFDEGGTRIGGKTGTHQDYRDAWYVGFSPTYSTAVWVGYEAEQIPLEDIVVRGQTYSRVFGSSIPAPIWKDFMTVVMENEPQVAFPGEPDNIADYLVPPLTTVPVVVGLDDRAATRELAVNAKLNVATELVPSLEPAGIVVAQSIEPGARVPQGTTVVIYVSNGETPIAPLLDLRGLTFDQALERVREFELLTGVTLSLIQQSIQVTSQNQVGLIVQTNPPPGTQITESATVVLMIGQLAPPDNSGGGGGGGGGGDG